MIRCFFWCDICLPFNRKDDEKSLDILGKQQFLKLADLLELQLSEVKDRQTFLEQKFPYIYNSLISRILKLVVRHK